MGVSESEVDKEFQDISELLPAEAPWLGSYFKGAGKYAALLAGSSAAMTLDRRAKRYTANAPVWVRFISFTAPDAVSIRKSVSVTFFCLDGKEIDKQVSVSADKSLAYVWVNALVVGFEIKSDAMLSKPSMSKININGFDLASFEQVAQKVSEAFDLKSALDKKIADTKSQVGKLSSDAQASQAKLDSLAVLIAEKEAEVAEFNEELQELHGSVATQQAQYTALEFSSTQLNNNIVAAKNNLQQLASQSKDLNEKIRTEKTELERLTSDKSLISDEYTDYVKEGKSQAGIYSLLSIIPLAVIIFAVDKLFVGAESILTHKYEGVTDIFAALLLRIPFSVVLGLGMYYSWKLAANLLGNIFRIHKDRLVLAKLLVIAKDTVFSSTQALDVSDEIKFSERVRLKIELLKSHLSRELSADFNYNRKTVIPDSSVEPANEDSEAAASTAK